MGITRAMNLDRTLRRHVRFVSGLEVEFVEVPPDPQMGWLRGVGDISRVHARRVRSAKLSRGSSVFGQFHHRVDAGVRSTDVARLRDRPGRGGGPRPWSATCPNTGRWHLRLRGPRTWRPCDGPVRRAVASRSRCPLSTYASTTSAVAVGKPLARPGLRAGSDVRGLVESGSASWSRSET